MSFLISYLFKIYRLEVNLNQQFLTSKSQAFRSHFGKLRVDISEGSRRYRPRKHGRQMRHASRQKRLFFLAMSSFKRKANTLQVN